MRHICIFLSTFTAGLFVSSIATASEDGIGPMLLDESAEQVTAEDTTTTEISEDAAAAELSSEPVAAAPISMDRSDWPHIVVTPADGTVTHHPQFVGNVPMGEDEVGPLNAPDPVWQIQEALLGAEADNLNGDNLTDLVTRPIIGLAQFVLIPFQAVLENPWSEATSP